MSTPIQNSPNTVPGAQSATNQGSSPGTSPGTSPGNNQGANNTGANTGANSGQNTSTNTQQGSNTAPPSGSAPSTSSAPTSASGTAATAPVTATVTATVTSSASSATQVLQSGTVVSGTLATSPGSGAATIILSTGRVDVQTVANTPLPPTGTAVELRVLQAGPPIQVRISASAQSQTPTATAGASPAVVSNISFGSPSVATLLSLGSGTSVQPAAPSAVPASVPASGASGATALQQLSTATTGATIPVRFLAAAPPGSPQPAVSTASLPNGVNQANVTNGTVINSTSNPISRPPIGNNAGATASGVTSGLANATVSSGATLVSTSMGVLSVAGSARAAPLPAGTSLLLEFLGPPTAATSSSSIAGQGASSASAFAGLKEAITLINQAGQITPPSQGADALSPPMQALLSKGVQSGDIANLMQALQSLTPNAATQSAPQFGAALVFFLHAMRLGGVERWVGPAAARGLETLRNGLGGRIDRDFQSRQGRARDASGAEWRSMEAPVSVPGEVAPLRLFVKDPPPEDTTDAEDEEQAQRFVIEVNFTRLGPMQLDTLVRGNQFDLMIRTHTPLPDDMRRDIHQLYTTALHAMGKTGSVDFYTVPAFEFEVLDAAEHPTHPSDRAPDRPLDRNSVEVTA